MGYARDSGPGPTRINDTPLLICGAFATQRTRTCAEIGCQRKRRGVFARHARVDRALDRGLSRYRDVLLDIETQTFSRQARCREAVPHRYLDNFGAYTQQCSEEAERKLRGPARRSSIVYDETRVRSKSRPRTAGISSFRVSRAIT